MAKIMAVTHIGITVLCLYPTPKGRNPPSSLYINDGCSQCMEPKRRTNNIIEIVSLCICKNRFVSIYDICSFFLQLSYIIIIQNHPDPDLRHNTYRRCNLPPIRLYFPLPHRILPQ